ncbi:helix-turn-helix domain-containing protein [Streptomyces sp. NPDC059009]|uniref:helix-turn-helix domain-containing protein n=1 Tax=Streptomyces sp. NPDC059009 TaxID=3346694 RepID=UPI003673F4BC
MDGSSHPHRHTALGGTLMTPPPVPNPAAGEAEFMAELRRLKEWSGLSYRELERAAASAGEVLPYSTAATMLRRDRLPREAVLVAFAVACGLDADATGRWVAARRELAMGPRPPRPTVVERPVRHRPRPRLSPLPRLRLAAVGAVAAVAVLLGAGAAVIGTGDTQEEQTVRTVETVGSAQLP